MPLHSRRRHPFRHGPIPTIPNPRQAALPDLAQSLDYPSQPRLPPHESGCSQRKKHANPKNDHKNEQDRSQRPIECRPSVLPATARDCTLGLGLNRRIPPNRRRSALHRRWRRSLPVRQRPVSAVGRVFGFRSNRPDQVPYRSHTQHDKTNQETPTNESYKQRKYDENYANNDCRRRKFHECAPQLTQIRTIETESLEAPV